MLSLREVLIQANSYVRELPALPLPLTKPVGAEISAWIDHTMLKPEATAGQVKKLCEEARQYQFVAVCVNPVYVPLARGLLKDADVGICTVIAFPLGAILPEDKVYEARRVIENGATEVDMVTILVRLKVRLMAWC
jgi:deoxyribose-phosphate aldolase